MFIEQYDRDTKAIKEELLRMCWYMRGSITYEDAVFLSDQERKIISSIIDGNLETTKKSGLPFF
jgi:ABC-type antimicrobial peptide transport system permease subunit